MLSANGAYPDSDTCLCDGQTVECLFGCLHHLTCRYKAAFVAKYGPVSIALDDMPQLWFPYKGGIMKGCCDKTATHAVLIVGYGEEAGTKYWIIKNRYVRKHRSGQVRHRVLVRHYDDSRRRGCVRTWARGCCCPLYVQKL